jgi:DNA polymerase-1
MVRTRLGRTSPTPSAAWQELTGGADDSGESSSSSRQAARNWGRFTRNFVVQGTAAEWALCWLADLRRRLLALGEVRGRRPALVYFLHDEVIVETPAELADAVSEAVRAAARRAGELLFGRFPVEFALDVACVQSYAEAG